MTSLIKRELDREFGLPSLLDAVFPSKLLKDYPGWDSFYTTDVFPYDVKVYKDDDGNPIKHELTFAVAGVDKNDVSVKVKDNWLIIDVKQTKDVDEDNVEYIRRGLSHRSMTKKFYLRGINQDKIQSKLENGLLTIVAYPEEDSTKTIDIVVN